MASEGAGDEVPGLGVVVVGSSSSSVQSVNDEIFGVSVGSAVVGGDGSGDEVDVILLSSSRCRDAIS